MDEAFEALNGPTKQPEKTLSQLLAEGVPHKGGMAQLASALETGALYGLKVKRPTPPPQEACNTNPSELKSGDASTTASPKDALFSERNEEVDGLPKWPAVTTDELRAKLDRLMANRKR